MISGALEIGFEDPSLFLFTYKRFSKVYPPINCYSWFLLNLFILQYFLGYLWLLIRHHQNLFRGSIIVVHSANRHILILRNCGVLSFSSKNRNHLISRNTSTKIKTDLLRVYVTNFLYVKVLRSHVLFKTQKVLEMFMTKCKRTSCEAWLCCLFPCGLSSVDFCAKKSLWNLRHLYQAATKARKNRKLRANFITYKQ